MAATLATQPNGVLITDIAKPLVLLVPAGAFLYEFANGIRVENEGTCFDLAIDDIAPGGTATDAIAAITSLMPA